MNPIAVVQVVVLIANLYALRQLPQLLRWCFPKRRT